MQAGNGRRRSIPACAGEPIGIIRIIPTNEVYPRVCGGTKSSSGGSYQDRGLSPRVRGNLTDRSQDALANRSIPACAGEPPAGTHTPSPAGVYPRVCGGTSSLASMPQADMGLSPRVRGNPTVTLENGGNQGSIPACAGEPPAGRAECRWPRVYPRVCGGTLADPGSHPGGRGLSPRVRGNPVNWQPISYLYEVYPRVCGGTDHFHQEEIIMKGLSPRVRGNQLRRISRMPSPRSIPACAGEPIAEDLPDAQSAVYPRVCGGTSPRSIDFAKPRGLSPRVRGNQRAPCNGNARQWSIPACAGEPSSRRLGRWGTRVYPRVCGGTPNAPLVLRDGEGLSPRVRGNRRQDPPRADQNGSIPACAGEPAQPHSRPRTQPVYPRVCGEPRRHELGDDGGWVYPRVCGGTYVSMAHL